MKILRAFLGILAVSNAICVVFVLLNQPLRTHVSNDRAAALHFLGMCVCVILVLWFNCLIKERDFKRLYDAKQGLAK